MTNCQTVKYKFISYVLLGRIHPSALGKWRSRSKHCLFHWIISVPQEHLRILWLRAISHLKRNYVLNWLEHTSHF